MKIQEFQFKHLRLAVYQLLSHTWGYVPNCLYEIRRPMSSKKKTAVFLRWVETLSQMEYGVLRGRHNCCHAFQTFMALVAEERKKRTESWIHNV